MVGDSPAIGNSVRSYSNTFSRAALTRVPPRRQVRAYLSIWGLGSYKTQYDVPLSEQRWWN
ncbi:MAG: hypothetical protein PWR07_2244 [Bacillota bacterium]|nr:hypothetical protein [Bacillota bacterium]